MKLTGKLQIYGARLLVFILWMAAWEYIPILLRPAGIVLFNPIYISSPSRIAADLYQLTLVTGAIWPALASTLAAAIVGLVLGMLSGYFVALVFSEVQTLDSVMMIYINAINAIPRITMYPLIVIIFGFGFNSKIVGAFLVTFFLVFYNAYRGSKTVPSEMTNNYAFLGAQRWQLVRYIRAYVALGWAVALLPSAMAFAIISVITTEILISTGGLGALIIIATSYLDTSRVFSIIVVSMTASVAMVSAAHWAINRAFPWIVAIG